MSSAACSNFHLLLIAFPSLSSPGSPQLFFLTLFLSFSFWNFPFTQFAFSLFPSAPVLPTLNRLLFPLVSLWPPPASACSLHLSHHRYFQPQCQEFALSITFPPSIHSFQQCTVPSVTAQHPHWTPLTPSLWWLIPSVTRLSHTHTRPSHFHQSVNPFKRESSLLLCWCDCEVRPQRREGRKQKGRLCQNRY